MGVKWTEEQKKVIDLRNRDLLVSAAAGSGKTAVLVERIIQKITDPEHPTEVDRMLIVTFTEAAAAEMKERIGAAIEKELAVHPDNLRMERQASLIYSAPITTIHSFCLSVLREHFHVIGMDPGFRVAEEGELRLLKQDVMEELLEQCYEQGEERFLSFAEKYGTGKDDRKLESLILNLYEYSRSYPDPKGWLASCVDAYRMGQGEQAGQAAVLEWVLDWTRNRLGDLRQLAIEGIRICQQPDGPYTYEETLEADLELLESLICPLNQGEGYEKIKEALEGVSWKALSRKKCESASEEAKEQVKKLRKNLKEEIGSIQKLFYRDSLEQIEKEMESCIPVMETLAGLVLQFAEMFREKKRQRSLIDFGDMEQSALQILTERKDGSWIPSPVAREYQDRFDEVMIDEYQDSNLVQETILSSVSRRSRGMDNVFMVGDVKQSIYRFRLSRPELFMEKYNTYTQEDSKRQRIDLHKNFRSRPEVLDSVNELFFRIMRKEIGGVEYDQDAALYVGATFPPAPEEMAPMSNETEVLALDKRGIPKGEERKTEARMIARRMKELLACGRVVDKKTGEYRKPRYQDMVILTRSLQGWADEFQSVLLEEGIPAYAVSHTGYFEAYEVGLLLDYLSILDNRRQEIPLAALLTSPFCGLNAEEMAKIRLAYPKRPFYEAVECFAEEGGAGWDGCEEEPVREKLRGFLSELDEFRKKASYTAVDELIVQILEKTGYGVYMAAMEGGAQRTANLEMLVEKAAAFGRTSYKGLYHFVRYISQLKKYDVEYGEAGMHQEQADLVRIMSIHKSKGLEFPIVFVAGMGKRFNSQDLRGTVLLHPERGVGLEVIDLERRTKTPSLLKKMISQLTMTENLGEELRVLYVAMTRAKEKLILTGAAEKMENYHMIGDQGRMGLWQIEKASSYFGWILPVILSAREQGRRCTMGLRQVTYEELGFLREAEKQADSLARETLLDWDRERVYDLEYRALLEQQMSYRYPYEVGNRKLKFTVTELKKRMQFSEEPEENLYEEPVVVPLIPEFLREEENVTGAKRGTAYHRFLELHDFTGPCTEESLREERDRFVQAGKLSREQAESIGFREILGFLESDIGQRLSRAAKRGACCKEQPFVIGMDASELYPEIAPGEETILVQGIIDVYLEEEDGIVVLDYKTDRVSEGALLRERYQTQLEYYAQALERLLGKPVKEKLIYSFALGEEIII